MQLNYKETDSDDIQYYIKPSQWVNFWWGLLIIVSIISTQMLELSILLVGIPTFIWGCKWLIIKCWSFRFHEKTIAEKKGVFSVLTREIHYSRVKSIRYEQPFLLRIFGLSNVVLITSDPLIPVLSIYAVKDGELVKTFIKEEISKWRRNRGVNEMDMYPLM